MDLNQNLLKDNPTSLAYGLSITTPLTLFRNPISNSEVASKQYVDNKTLTINASRVKTGILAKEIFPIFSGSVFSFINTGNLQLTYIVQQGIYCKVSVNSTGRVLTGYDLVEDDIPSLSWNKIESDLPNDLDGYGINNAINNTGGIAEGFISSSVVPSEYNHAVTKNYVDAVLSSDGGGGIAVPYPIGSIIKVSSSNAGSKSGYLICDGGRVNKINYTNLYSVIGDRFNTTITGSVTPWRSQHIFNNQEQTFSNEIYLSTESILNLTEIGNNYSINNTLIVKNKIYVFTTVRKDITNFPNNGKIFSRTILSNGELDPNTTWIEELNSYNYPYTRYNTFFIVKNKLYMVGGLSSVYPNDDYDSIDEDIHYGYIWRSIINEDGTLNDFERIGRFPFHLKEFQVVQSANKIHFINGRYKGGSDINYDYFDKLVTMEIDTNGDFINQGSAGNGLFIPLYTVRSMYINSEQRTLYLFNSSIAVTKAGIYVIGGERYNNNYDRAVIFDNKIIKLALNEQGDVTTIEPINVNIPITNKLLASSKIIQTKNSIFLLYGFYSFKENSQTNEIIVYNHLDEMTIGNYVIANSNSVYKLDVDLNGEIFNCINYKEFTNSNFINLETYYISLLCTSSKMYIIYIRTIIRTINDFKILSTDFFGGYNDYTLTNPNLVDNSGTTFTLPDLTSDLNKTYYIKY